MCKYFAKLIVEDILCIQNGAKDFTLPFSHARHISKGGFPAIKYFISDALIQKLHSTFCCEIESSHNIYVYLHSFALCFLVHPWPLSEIC